MKNMVEYINTGTTNDMATESIDIEIKEAIIQNIWSLPKLY